MKHLLNAIMRLVGFFAILVGAVCWAGIPYVGGLEAVISFIAGLITIATGAFTILVDHPAEL